MPKVLRPETFNVVLLESEPLLVSMEQREKIRDILEIGASDSRFAQKMYLAIERVLTGGKTIPPVVDSLSPNTAVIGSPSFTLHVMGSGFKSDSVIMWNGAEEPTTFVTDKEVTTGVNMDTAVAAISLPVAVLNSDGVMSDPQTFTFTSQDEQAQSFKNIPKETHTTPLPHHKTTAEEHHQKGSE